MVTLPIIVVENQDVMRFESTHDACGYVEAIDVENGEYQFFDSEAQRLKAVRDRGQVVDLVPYNPPRVDREWLTARLRAYFYALAEKRQQPGRDPQSLELDSLLAELPATRRGRFGVWRA